MHEGGQNLRCIPLRARRFVCLEHRGSVRFDLITSIMRETGSNVFAQEQLRARNTALLGPLLRWRVATIVDLIRLENPHAEVSVEGWAGRHDSRGTAVRGPCSPASRSTAS